MKQFSSYTSSRFTLPNTKKIEKKYTINNDELVSPDEVFAGINKKYTKPGALLLGIRIREGLTQAEMAKKIKLAQSDISQMENGARSIGRKIAQRIQKLFDVTSIFFGIMTLVKVN